MDAPLVYLDNAATTWPKPPAVGAALTHYLAEIGGSPGRGGHRLAQQAGRVVLAAREALAELFHLDDPAGVIFTKNATEALNVALFGLLRAGDRVVVGGAEHNALMRPLRALEAHGQITLTVVPCDRRGVLDLDALRAALRAPARLVALAHASNVTGVLVPLDVVGGLARAAGALFLVDAAQTAGACPIDMAAMPIDLLAFTGHKNLFGPQGTGGLCLRPDLRLQPLLYGGTGSNSELEIQPDFLPDQLESGTLNGLGVAGLAAGVGFVLEQGVERIRAHDQAQLTRLAAGLAALPGVTVYGPADPAQRTHLVSFTLANMSVAEAGQRLDEEFGVLCRVGLHCAPAAHRTLGTFPSGTVRFSLSYLNTAAHVDQALAAVRALAAR